MRISDWSSDVCSSDLAGLTGTRTATDGSLLPVPVAGAFEKGAYKNSTWLNILHGDHDLGALRLNWDAAYVATESSPDLPIINQTSSRPSQRPTVRYPTGQYCLPGLTLSETPATRGP